MTVPASFDDIPESELIGERVLAMSYPMLCLFYCETFAVFGQILNEKYVLLHPRFGNDQMTMYASVAKFSITDITWRDCLVGAGIWISTPNGISDGDKFFLKVGSRAPFSQRFNRQHTKIHILRCQAVRIH